MRDGGYRLVELAVCEQGGWTVENYLALDGGLLVEYTDGFIRVLPMPTLPHQWIVRFLVRILDRFVSDQHLGVLRSVRA